MTVAVPLTLQPLARLLLGLQMLLGPTAPDAPEPREPDPPKTLWAGHQVTYGEARIPFRGTVPTRTDAYVLATIERRDDRVEISERACKIDISKVAGVQAKIDAKHLPRTSFRLARRVEDDAGDLYQGTSRVRWRSEDLDRDGKPGMTIEIGGRICRGELHVANDSRTVSTLRVTDGKIEGHASVRVSQEILGARGACLSTFARDSNDHFSGPVAYVPVAPTTTCAQLNDGVWPVDATQ